MPTLGSAATARTWSASGARVYSVRLPDPIPAVFGFHEVFHALVIAAGLIVYVAIAAVTIAELRVGALIANRKRKTTRSSYVDDIIATIPVLDYDLEVAEAHAELLVEVRSQGKPRGAHDLIIAATAKAFHRTVVSADRTAFRDLPGVEVRSRR